MPRMILTLTGQTFGRLTAMYATGDHDDQGRRVWRCVCDCGVWKDATTSDLRRRRTQSCGCLKADVRRGRPLIRHSNKPDCCTADGCERDVFEKGLFCQMHSRRVDRHGAPDRVVTNDARILLSSYGVERVWAEMAEAA